MTDDVFYWNLMLLVLLLFSLCKANLAVPLPRTCLLDHHWYVCYSFGMFSDVRHRQAGMYLFYVCRNMFVPALHSNAKAPQRFPSSNTVCASTAKTNDRKDSNPFASFEVTTDKCIAKAHSGNQEETVLLLLLLQKKSLLAKLLHPSPLRMYS